MESSYLRTFVKGIIWELLGLAVILLLTSSFQLSLTYISIRVIMYFFYHRLWKNIGWGKKETEHSHNEADTY